MDSTVAATFVCCIRTASGLAENLNLPELVQFFRPDSCNRLASYRLVQV